MTANVQLSIQTKRNVLTLPKDAVQMDQDKKTVTVLNGDQPEQRIVTTGISDKKYYEILSGVAEKEKVILNQ
jgi:multidrug efflux pump subunit AcrA (membrane-fusion protein)